MEVHTIRLRYGRLLHKAAKAKLAAHTAIHIARRTVTTPQREVGTTLQKNVMKSGCTR